MIVLPVLPQDRIFIRLDKTPERDEWTDGQTDRAAVAITAVSITRNVGQYGHAVIKLYTTGARSHQF